MDNYLLLAKRTHRTKTFYAREAILCYLEDLEDTYDALKSLKNSKGTYSLEEIVNEPGFTKEDKKEIGLAD